MAPPSKIIHRTIKELCYNHLYGCLVLICGSGENILNFGFAVEKSLTDCLRVQVLVISDDYSNSNTNAFKQGSSGVILISKIAGSMSERNMPLLEIHKFCGKLLSNILSIGVNVKDIAPNLVGKCFECTRNKSVHKRSHSLERSSNEMSISDIYNCTMGEILSVEVEEDNEEEEGEKKRVKINEESKIYLKSGDHIVILLNNIGALTKTEEFIFIQHSVDTLKKIPIYVQRFYISNAIKFNNKDISVTVMKVETTEVLKYLDDPCTAVGKVHSLIYFFKSNPSRHCLDV